MCACRIQGGCVSELNLDTLQWTHPKITGANPFPRSGHSSTVVGKNLIAIFGGRLQADICYNDIFLLNVETYACILVNAVETLLPTPIANCSLCAIGSKVYCFGGTDVKGECYNDLRVCDLNEYLDKKDISVAEGAASDYSFKVRDCQRIDN